MILPGKDGEGWQERVTRIKGIVKRSNSGKISFWRDLVMESSSYGKFKFWKVQSLEILRYGTIKLWDDLGMERQSYKLWANQVNKKTEQ